MPALIATTWFEDTKRPLVITIASVFYPLGISIGFVIPNLFVDEYSEDYVTMKKHILQSLLLQAAIGVIIYILVVLTIPGEPKYPPSINASMIRDDDILGTWRYLVVNREFIKLAIAFG